MMAMNSPSSVPPGDRAGRRLGEFVLGEKIGEGAFGAIYLAQQVGLPRQVVVKILRSRFHEDETTRLRFLQEARLASTLDHPYAAHVYAFGVEPDGVSWIAMELVRGTPLSEVLRAGAMPLRVFVPFFERLCEVVHTAHEHGIVHRDIKPSNVMVITRAGTLLPKLLDLGIAKDAAFEGDGRKASTAPPRPPAEGEADDDATIDWTSGSRLARSSLTGEGDVVGSPSYMAPEQWTHADQVDARCDIYALGVLAYEAVVGRRPFRGTVTELAEQHFAASVPALPEGLPNDLNAVLARAMAKLPGDRYATALDLGRAFREASRLGADGVELPRLARGVAEAALRDYPQPLAEAVAELDGARGAYRALDAAARVVHVSLRFLVVLTLAAWNQRRGEHALPSIASELLSALRKRRLEDEEWLELLRAFAAHGAWDGADHPFPALLAFLGGPGMTALGHLVVLHSTRSVRTFPTERAAADALSGVLTPTAELLDALAFFADHPLAVVGEDHYADLWVGVRRRHRVERAFLTTWSSSRARRFSSATPIALWSSRRWRPCPDRAPMRTPRSFSSRGAAVGGCCWKRSRAASSGRARRQGCGWIASAPRPTSTNPTSTRSKPPTAGSHR
jgi:tRNA A-37 threonylcarbamoyl transferase component Bud32